MFFSKPNDINQLRDEKIKLNGENRKLINENESLLVKNRKLTTENEKLNVENRELNARQKKISSEKSKYIIKNSQLNRIIRSEKNKQHNQKQTITRLRRNVDSLKKKVRRKELKLKEVSENPLINSGLNVRGYDMIDFL